MTRAEPVPRSKEDNYTADQATRRRTFLTDKTGALLEHVGRYAIEVECTRGNIENFIGCAQVPLGLAGPIRIEGEHARGDFYIPMATTEGTLVASYSRGMRAISESGGVKTTVAKHSMQRAPVFICADALEARTFGAWLVAQFPAIQTAAQTTTRIGQLFAIEQYPVANMLYTRFCFTTGDAAGQNMTSQATFAACEWILRHHPNPPRYILSGAIDTDKKHSAMNMIQTRGKRVIAEFTLRQEVARDLLRIDTRRLFEYRQIAAVGALQAGSAYSGAHAANGLAALFIATGQDAANVAESHGGITYGQLLENGDYYWSVTLPALICATYGGGTALPTQRECLEVLGCFGAGKADKLAEIIAAVVLAGDVSLTSAVLAGDWVTSHEALGRNR